MRTGAKTGIAATCEVSGRIRSHLKAVERLDVGRSGRLVLWRLVIRVAQDEYDRELQELESLNSLKADPATEVPVV